MGAMRDRLCTQVYKPEYLLSAKAFTFVMQGKAADIDSKVTRPALGSDYVVSSLGTTSDLFAVSWVRYSSFTSALPQGRFSYNESALFNVVQDAGGVKHLYVPSLYLDSSAAITSGRDVFGFPKAWGDVSLSAVVPTKTVTLSTEADEIALAGNPASRRRIYSV